MHVFNGSLTAKYFFSEVGSKTACLVCNKCDCIQRLKPDYHVKKKKRTEKHWSIRRREGDDGVEIVSILGYQ